MPSGNYVVEGRVKDLINRGGEKISAEEVENLILAHPAVLNVACVPYPDPVLGERMCACLVLRAGQSLSLEELVAFLRGFEIATFKLPERVAVFDTLPLSGFGKVSKKELAARLASEVSMSRVDLHCYPGTAGVDRLAGALRRGAGPVLGQGMGGQVRGRRGRRRVRGRGRGGAGRLRHRVGDRRPALHERLRRRACATGIRRRSSAPGGRSTRSRASRRSPSAVAAVREHHVLGFHFHPIMGHYAVDDRP